MIFNFHRLSQLEMKHSILKVRTARNYSKSAQQTQKRFTICFDNIKNFSDQIKNWEKNLTSCIYKCFPIIRSRKRKFIESNIRKFIEERKKIKLELAINPSVENKHIKQKLDIKISQETESEFTETVQETLGHITGADGGIITHGM